MLPSYRKQSIDLLCKSINWFLYEGNTGTEWVKVKLKMCIKRNNQPRFQERNQNKYEK